MPLYLLQENGSKLLLENLSGFVILEAVGVPPATIYYQGGAGRPVWTRKKRRETQRLFDDIAITLEELVGLRPPPVVDAQRAAPPLSPVHPGWTPAELTDALSRLATLAQGHEGLETRFERLNRMLLDYQSEEASKIDDDETWMLMA